MSCLLLIKTKFFVTILLPRRLVFSLCSRDYHPRIAAQCQKARIGQEKQSASRKRPRSHVFNEDKIKIINNMGEGVKMATQAMEMRVHRASLNLHSGLGQIRIGDLGTSRWVELFENLRIAIAVKLMVKMKNLFRLKDGLRPCLEDVNVK
jgi:hypothetical protein